MDSPILHTLLPLRQKQNRRDAKIELWSRPPPPARHLVEPFFSILRVLFWTSFIMAGTAQEADATVVLAFLRKQKAASEIRCKSARKIRLFWTHRALLHV